jgi:hypothetical protein
LLFEADRPRADLVASIIGHLRVAGARVELATGWDDYDARLLASRLVVGDLVTSSHPIGYVQIAVRRRILHRRCLGLASLILMLAVVDTSAAFGVGAIGAVDALLGVWRTGPSVRRKLSSQGVAATCDA